VVYPIIYRLSTILLVMQDFETIQSMFQIICVLPFVFPIHLVNVENVEIPMNKEKTAVKTKPIICCWSPCNSLLGWCAWKWWM
jgi:hypothetical protein